MSYGDITWEVKMVPREVVIVTVIGTLELQSYSICVTLWCLGNTIILDGTSNELTELVNLISVTFSPIEPVFVRATSRNFEGLFPNHTFSITRFSCNELMLFEKVLDNDVV